MVPRNHYDFRLLNEMKVFFINEKDSAGVVDKEEGGKVMAAPYNHKAIEKKWRENWEKNPVNIKEDANGKREKYYCLDMFPYPS